MCIYLHIYIYIYSIYIYIYIFISGMPPLRAGTAIVAMFSRALKTSQSFAPQKNGTIVLARKAFRNL